MEHTRRRVFFKEKDFQTAWNPYSLGAGIWSGARHLDRAPKEALSDAAHFLGGALLGDGFQLFRNGGLPQLERRYGPLIEEIILRPSPYVSGEPFLPMRVCMHLSHTGLQQMRMRYWSPPSRAPAHVTTLNLGQLELPPCWVIWNIGQEHQTLVELVDWVRRLALPWFELFEKRYELHDRLFQMEIPYVELDTALELVIAEFGEFEGNRFINECVLADKQMGPLLRSACVNIRSYRGVVEIGAGVVKNVAAICSCYGYLI